MLDVWIYNGEKALNISGDRVDGRVDGEYVEEINAIPSATFTIYPDNVGFNQLTEFVTRVRIFKKEKCVFSGRVILVEPSVESNGTVSKKVTCEGALGYLNDTFAYPLIGRLEGYDITLTKAVQFMIDFHNKQVGESSKKYIVYSPPESNTILENVEVTAESSTWGVLSQEAFTDDLDFKITDDLTKLTLSVLGDGDVGGGVELTLDVNMQSISIVPSFDLCTRVVPFTTEGLPMGTIGMNETDYYVEDKNSKKIYGVIVKGHKFDSVKKTSSLKEKATKWLKKNSSIIKSISVSALDLYNQGITPAQFEVGKTYPIRCPQINFNETVKLRKVTRDINDEWNVQLEFGEKKYSAKRYIKLNKYKKGMKL